MITQSITINLIPSGISPRIKVSQYDTGAEAIEVTLLNGTEAYEIPADATVLLTGRTSGGQVFTKKATTASGSVATFDVIDAMTASAGTAKAEVEILDGQTVLGSANFDIYVEPSPVRKDNTAESDWSDLQAMANAVVAAGKKIDDAEQVVADATDAANKANEAITAIGDNVERSETAATSAEAAQTAAEAAQGKAESAQTAAETAEQSASASATTATTKATEAETNASAAAESSDAAKAWAVGPSDELTAGTDTDNAKYYAAQAKASADKAESMSTVGIATTSTVGIVKPDGDSITVDADGTIHGASKVPVATTEAVGTVKPDGDTITIDEDGTIHGVSKITVDDALSDTSENPVQNKAIKAAIDAQKETIAEQGTKITANETAIATKADKTSLDTKQDKMTKWMPTFPATWAQTDSIWSASITEGVDGITADTDVEIVGFVSSGTASTDATYKSALGTIISGVTAENSVTLYASEQPSVTGFGIVLRKVV